MTNPTLEKVARAMCAELGINPDDWDEPLDGPRVYRWQLELPTARAALQSLRQVDDETVEAMCRTKLPPLMQHGLAGLPTDGESTRRQVAELAASEIKSFTSAIDHILGQEP